QQQIKPTELHGSLGYTLNTGENDWLEPIPSTEPGRIDAHGRIRPIPGQLVGVLADKFSNVSEHTDARAGPGCQRLADHFGQYNCFATTGWDDDARVP